MAQYYDKKTAMVRVDVERIADTIISGISEQQGTFSVTLDNDRRCVVLTIDADIIRKAVLDALADPGVIKVYSAADKTTAEAFRKKQNLVEVVSVK